MKENLRNPFFKDRSPGPEKSISLQQMLNLALGYRPCGGSKRLKNAITVCNGRLYVGDQMLWDGDLNIYEKRFLIEHIASFFSVKIDLLQESGECVVWTSEFPHLWSCWPAPSGNSMPIEAAYPAIDAECRKQQKQWMIDHGLAKPPTKAKKKKTTVKSKR
jgi:hypothetical protein